ncbi:CAP domain-containing protein, partial [uncultured Lactobacillus sp.]|uniref:CAP domain-containing protein n=1 Tax=uncultured Lactobacillus sp. TaxID=153152 RepID=UPI00345D79B9
QNGGQTTPSKPITPVTPSQNNKGTWSNAEVQEAQSAFIDYVNNWRRKEGLNPFENTVSWLQEGAESRANDNQKLFEETGNISHTRPNGSDWTTAFNVKSGSLGGENIGYEGNSNGMTPVEAAQQIANGFINEGPDGGHYAVLHAAYGTHPAIGVAFRNVYRDGQQVYLLNMETGTNSRVAGVATVLSGDAEHEQEWAAKWKGMTAPSLKEYVYTKNGKVHVRKSDFPNDMGYEPGEVEKYPQLHLMPEDQLQSYEDAYVKYLQEKYNAIVE